jgi:crotonobetainyl-CoA:carnitine CoA-transferase CaiB-like acyl-CoA transferase
MPQNPRPLTGFTVLDLTLAMAGPLSTQRLADLGADVIKIETPAGGDSARSFPIDGVLLDGPTSPSFLALNRGKRSLTLNLKHGQGREILLRLVETADVLVQNFRPGVMERLGLGAETALERNPRLVYVSISGYGSSGPMSQRPGQDLLAQAFTGLMWNAGRDGEPPVPAPVFVADAIASHLATEAALAGLLQASRSGQGTAIDVSLLGGLLDLQSQELVTYMASGRQPQRGAAPYAHTMLDPPYGVYQTLDGYLVLAMADIAELETLLDAPALSTAVDRDAIYHALAEPLARRTTEDWMALFAEHDVWAAPVLSYAEMLGHEQVLHERFITRLHHPAAGEVNIVSSPFVIDGTRSTAERHPPLLGEHTNEILGEIGFSSQEIEDLHAFDAV